MTALVHKLRGAPDWLTDALIVRRWQIIVAGGIAGLIIGAVLVLGIREARHAEQGRDNLAAANRRQDADRARLARAIRDLRALKVRTRILRNLSPAQARRLREFLMRETPSSPEQRPAPSPRLVVPEPSPRQPPGGIVPAPRPGPSPPPTLVVPPPSPQPNPSPVPDLLQPVCPLLPPTPQLPVQAPALCS